MTNSLIEIECIKERPGVGADDEHIGWLYLPQLPRPNDLVRFTSTQVTYTIVAVGYDIERDEPNAGASNKIVAYVKRSKG